jgi:hypothetical protein
MMKHKHTNQTKQLPVKPVVKKEKDISPEKKKYLELSKKRSVAKDGLAKKQRKHRKIGATYVGGHCDAICSYMVQHVKEPADIQEPVKELVKEPVKEPVKEHSITGVPLKTSHKQAKKPVKEPVAWSMETPEFKAPDKDISQLLADNARNDDDDEFDKDGNWLIRDRGDDRGENDGPAVQLVQL